MTTQDERNAMIAKAWQLYRQIPAVQRAVDLHAAGFASGSLSITVLADKGADVSTLEVVVDNALLRRIGLEMFVAGEASAKIETAPQQLLVTEGDDFQVIHDSLSNTPTNRQGDLWTLAVNHGFLTSPAAAAMPDEVQRMIAGVLPLEMLSTAAALEMTGERIASELFFYASRVENMRNSFSSAIRRHLGQRVLAESWHPPLWSELAVKNNAWRAGPIYQVFRAEGIELANLKSVAISRAEEAATVQLISTTTADLIRASYE